MAVINYVELNIFALVVLFLMFIRVEKRLFEQKLFIALLGSNALLLIFDSMMWLIDGRPGILFRYVNLTISAIYLGLNPLPCILWAIYAHYQVYRDKKIIRKYIIPMLIPAIINTILVILSCFKGYIFYIDPENAYRRGKFFLLMPSLCFIYLMSTLIFIIINREKFEKRYYIPILAFVIPPIIGGLLQALYYGLSLVWLCMTISVLMVFINTLSSQLYTDHLTGLYNRRQLDFYFKEKSKNLKNNFFLAGIMLDVNSFKEINDVWGHTTGDMALIDASKILSASLENNGLICRYGGDEFVILMELKEKSELLKTVERIKMNTENFNKTKSVPYAITFSFGYGIYDFKSNTDQFLKQIDSLMYKDKKNKIL